MDAELHIIDLADNALFYLNTKSVTAAVAEFDHCDPESGKRKAFKALSTVVKQLELDLKCYLVARNSGPQPVSASVLHSKMWKALKLSGFSLPAAEQYEVAIHSTSEVTFYGASTIPPGSIEDALKLYDGYKVAFVLASDGFDPVAFLNNWKSREWLPHDYPQNAPLEVVDVAVEHDVTVAFTIGAFDDPVFLVFTGGGELSRIAAILHEHLQKT